MKNALIKRFMRTQAYFFHQVPDMPTWLEAHYQAEHKKWKVIKCTAQANTITGDDDHIHAIQVWRGESLFDYEDALKELATYEASQPSMNFIVHKNTRANILGRVIK